jgi:hypothetical protein
MKKVIVIIIVIIVILFSIRSVYKKMTVFDGTEESFNFIILMLPIDKQIEFINDFELLANFVDGEHKLIGLKREDISKEAFRVKVWVVEQNIIFLKSYIEELKESNIKSTYLNINNVGRINRPIKGFVYQKRYTIEDLQQILNEQVKTLDTYK